MSGTMRERPSGSKRWELRAYVGQDPETGRPRQISRTFRGGKHEARKVLDALVHEVHEGHHVGTTATFGKLLDEWLRNLERLGKAKTTLETYRTHVEKHIRPELGAIRLDKLTSYDLDRYFQKLETDKGLATATIKLNHAVISGALSQGVDWGWIKANPAKRARLRDTARTEAASLTVDQLRALYQAAVTEDEDMAVVIALAALTGCRRGELCGLRWDDVDWHRASLKVERAWVPSQGGQHLTTTKTTKGRTVFIGAVGVALLEAYRATKRELVGHDPEGWLLSYDAGTTPMRAKTLTEYVMGLCRRLEREAREELEERGEDPATAARYRVHFHSLRHFAATELVHAGVDLPTAAGHLGHSPGVMAGVYLHSSDERGSQAGDLISAVVGKALELPAAAP